MFYIIFTSKKVLDVCKWFSPGVQEKLQLKQNEQFCILFKLYTHIQKTDKNELLFKIKYAVIIFVIVID